MIRFSLFGFPVTIQWMFWLTAALLGYGFARIPGRAGLTLLLVWVVVVFVSVLFHELGHAIAFRRFGQRPQIVLAAFGGYAQGSRGLTRRENILVSLAGPFFGFVLFGVCYFLEPLLRAPLNADGSFGWGNAINAFFALMIFVNLWWSILNLLPVLPLDGGRVLAAAVAHRRNPRIVFQVGLIVSIGVVIFALFREQIFLAIMFGLMGYSNWQRLQGAQRGTFW